MKDKAAAALGRKGGVKKTPAQQAARKLNAAKATAARMKKKEGK